jgi:hypothetical protein
VSQRFWSVSGRERVGENGQAVDQPVLDVKRELPDSPNSRIDDEWELFASSGLARWRVSRCVVVCSWWEGVELRGRLSNRASIEGLVELRVDRQLTKTHASSGAHHPR